MKYLFIIVLIAISYSQSFAANFSDLDNLCYSKADGAYTSNNDDLILRHINGKITKTSGYVKYNDYLYMVANTFTDNYRFLGTYLLRYDCKAQSTTKLSGLMKKNFSGERGFIQYSSYSDSIMIRHSGINGSTAAWIYDLETEQLGEINSRKLKKPNGYKLSWVVNLDSYDGKNIEIEKFYYTGNFIYLNLGNPEIQIYTF